MKQTFTPNHFLLAAYGELPASTAQLMHVQMEDNEQSAIELQSIIDMQEVLDSFELKPSPTSVKIIMDYSRQTSDADMLV